MQQVTKFLQEGLKIAPPYSSGLFQPLFIPSSGWTWGVNLYKVIISCSTFLLLLLFSLYFFEGKNEEDRAGRVAGF